MDVRDVVLLVVGGLISVSALVRMMLVRHNRLLEEARAQIEAEGRRKADEAAKTANPPRRAAS